MGAHWYDQRPDSAPALAASGPACECPCHSTRKVPGVAIARPRAVVAIRLVGCKAESLYCAACAADECLQLQARILGVRK
jgi:hypothetical protein